MWISQTREPNPLGKLTSKIHLRSTLDFKIDFFLKEEVIQKIILFDLFCFLASWQVSVFCVNGSPWTIVCWHGVWLETRQ